MSMVARILLTIWISLVTSLLVMMVLAWLDARKDMSLEALGDAASARAALSGALFFAVLTAGLFVI